MTSMAKTYWNVTAIKCVLYKWKRSALHLPKREAANLEIQCKTY